MPELSLQERLQPALLDRLTDEEPEKTQETRERRAISKSKLRQAVLRDLAWLFNTTRLEASTNLGAAPHARRSVINYGLPALSGQSASSLDVVDLERAIRQAIVDFEPRIRASTLQVTAIVHADPTEQHNVIGVEIRGDLWAQPVPIELMVRTEIDLETGKVELNDMLARGL